MTAEAEIARAVAVHFEAKLDGQRRVQSGDWKVTFTVAADQMPEMFSTDPMGQRYTIAAVARNDDETPRLPVKKEKKSFDELPSSQQAALLCNDPMFVKFLMAEGFLENDTPSLVADAVREYCNVASRAEIDVSFAAKERFSALLSQYRDYQTTQRYGDYV